MSVGTQTFAFKPARHLLRLKLSTYTFRVRHPTDVHPKQLGNRIGLWLAEFLMHLYEANKVLHYSARPYGCMPDIDSASVCIDWQETRLVAQMCTVCNLDVDVFAALEI
jgi:hypothetical protein